MTTRDATPLPRYRLYLLGGTSLIGPNGPLDEVSADERLLALLALLATVPPGDATREALAATVWPDAERDSALSALDASLKRLESLVGRELTTEVAGGLSLDPDVAWADVRSYRAHLGGGDRLAAAADYQGPFLDRFHLTGAAAFNQWMHHERSELANAFRELASVLAAEAMTAGDGQAAARWWTRLVDADPWNPGAALQAMDGFEAMGARTAAMAVAEEFVRRTGERLGRQPDAAVSARLRELQERPPSRAGSRWPLLAAVIVIALLLLWAVA